ncbi:hypothetical protein JCM19045_1942 [Bacillus sp. JCM 19045]|nr:hypothetical protein JCM19045_1942 [Bacillus sp. JCM 19045]
MITIRPYTLADYDGLLQVQKEAFPPPFPPELWWSQEEIASHVKTFPTGALLAEWNGEVFGSATSLLVNHADQPHTWAEVSDNGLIAGTHDPTGKTLYGIDLCVRPSVRKQGVAKAFYDARKQTVRDLKLDRYATVCRIPGYHIVADTYTPEQYVELVQTGELTDPVLTFMFKQGCKQSTYSLIMSKTMNHIITVCLLNGAPKERGCPNQDHH